MQATSGETRRENADTCLSAGIKLVDAFLDRHETTRYTPAGIPPFRLLPRVVAGGMLIGKSGRANDAAGGKIRRPRLCRRATWAPDCGSLAMLLTQIRLVKSPKISVRAPPKGRR